MFDRRLTMPQLALACLLAACRTAPLDGPLDPPGGGGRDLALAADLPASPDLGRCIPSLADGGSGCPCGPGGLGLCQPAGGRLSVQTMSEAGELRLVGMDDNGCRRGVVTSDQPVGVPRWAADHQRLAYLTAGASSVRVRVIGLSPIGSVTCRVEYRLPQLLATELAWAGEHELWLMARLPTPRLVRFLLGTGIVEEIGLGEGQLVHFDARGAGPLGMVVRRLVNGSAVEVVLTRPLVASGDLRLLATEPAGRIGNFRLSQDGRRAILELGDQGRFLLLPLDGSPARTIDAPGGRSPSFALDDRAIVHVTDDGKLRYALIDGPQAGVTLDLPTAWRRVFSPDWTPFPSTCEGPPSCQ